HLRRDSHTGARQYLRQDLQLVRQRVGLFESDGRARGAGGREVVTCKQAPDLPCCSRGSGRSAICRSRTNGSFCVAISTCRWTGRGSPTTHGCARRCLRSSMRGNAGHASFSPATSVDRRPESVISPSNRSERASPSCSVSTCTCPKTAPATPPR